MKKYGSVEQQSLPALRREKDEAHCFGLEQNVLPVVLEVQSLYTSYGFEGNVK